MSGGIHRIHYYDFFFFQQNKRQYKKTIRSGAAIILQVLLFKGEQIEKKHVQSALQSLILPMYTFVERNELREGPLT